MNLRAVILGTMLVVVVIGVPLAYKSRTSVRYRNFRTVEEGVLYRCGQLQPPAFERVMREYDIKAVVTFRAARREGERDPDEHEELYCKAHGISYHRLPPLRWGSIDGGPPPIAENVQKFLRIVEENRGRGPILIHCFAGIHRTGAYTALYRMEYNRWSNADAIAEMYDRGYVTLDTDPDIQEYLQTYVPRRLRRGVAATPGSD